MAAENIMEIKNLVVEYLASETVVHAVNGVSLTVKKGETIGLVGETGAGKTTIARAVIRILQEPPAKLREGEIYSTTEKTSLVFRKRRCVKYGEIKSP